MLKLRMIVTVFSTLILSTGALAEVRNPGTPVPLEREGTSTNPAVTEVLPQAPTVVYKVDVTTSTDESAPSPVVPLEPTHAIQNQGQVEFDNAEALLPKLTAKIDVEGAKPSGESTVTIRIAAGSEKKEWMNWAKEKWLATQPDVNGKPIEIIIESVGSIGSGRSIRAGNVEGFTVWSPASSFFRPLVENAYTTAIFETDTPLVNSPMVFLSFEEVQEKIDSEIQSSDGSPAPMSFDTIVKVMDLESEGTLQINDNGDWFKFAMTNPLQSNSGAMSTVIMAYEYFSRTQPKFRRITEANLNDPEFQKYLAFQKAYYDLSMTSTGKLGERLSASVRTLDSAIVYENVAVEQIRGMRKSGAKGRLVMRYPPRNLITDHPYYVLKHKTTSEERQAARMFMDFLMMKEQQLIAMQQFGFRPGSKDITSEEQDQVFGEFVANGLEPDLSRAFRVIPSQSGEIVEALLQLFDKIGYLE